MLFCISILMASVATINADQVLPSSVLPLEDNPDTVQVIPDPVTSVDAEPTEIRYDCRGSTMCPTIHVKACDEAVNSKLIRDDNVNYGAIRSGMPRVGECYGIASDYGCGVLIQGPKNCTRTGNDMWWDYQEIRSNGCHHCGHKYWSDWGCKTTIDYFPVCGIWH
ncbi:hypothetical protein F4820DRAFT_426777 [Hypoxylon rubiginosum]|uniref:Uncharacterized protein n=1 Tax=Hypoxylon rubiginosum TaxID=110542 RepID=A0ACB9YVH5_9PEZI|nr:hypothetical protein F4820DRAFT_426777 [Hypoxylon rubiginosum]